MAYAQHTEVSPERSRSEIERMLQKYGAKRFASGWDSETATIAFEAHDRRVRFTITMPPVSDFERAGKNSRSPSAQKSAHAQECRRRWRAIALVIKAKLEAVNSGVSTFEEEFLAFVVLPNGETIGDWLAPQIAKVYSTEKMPPLLGSGTK